MPAYSGENTGTPSIRLERTEELSMNRCALSLARTRLVPAGRSVFTLVLCVLVMTQGCGTRGGGRASRSVTMKGSDTMVILGQRWAEVYMQTHPGKTVQVTGGGSGTGIAALINGTTMIAQSSRPMKDTEKAKVEAQSRKAVEEHAVARDGVTVYVNKANPVETLTRDQIRSIYTGAITEWSEVGGPAGKIVVYGRESSSGTYVFFKEHVLGGADFAPQTQTLPGTSAVADAVTKDPAGIGYGGFAYGKGIKHLKVAPDAGSPGVAPSEETVRDGSYSLSRDLYWYFVASPPPEVTDLLNWVLSDSGQAVVRDVGYFPVRS
jgi:phosphate transport system substrate-binding protein